MVPASGHIICMPMFNSYGLVDRVLAGNGASSRSFVTVRNLEEAFIACGIQTDLLADQLEALKVGFFCEVPVSQSQMHTFYNGERPKATVGGQALVN